MKCRSTGYIRLPSRPHTKRRKEEISIPEGTTFQASLPARREYAKNRSFQRLSARNEDRGIHRARKGGPAQGHLPLLQNEEPGDLAARRPFPGAKNRNTLETRFDASFPIDPLPTLDRPAVSSAPRTSAAPTARARRRRRRSGSRKARGGKRPSDPVGDFAGHNRGDGTPFEVSPVEGGVARFAGASLDLVGPRPVERENREVSRIADRDAPVFAQNARRAGREKLHQAHDGNAARMDELVEGQSDSGLEPENAEGRFVELHVLQSGLVRRVIGGDGVDRAVGQAFP